MIGAGFSSYDHFAFDLDGVLVNSDAVVETALRRWAVEERLCPDFVLRASQSRRDVDLVADILPGRWAEREAIRIAEYEIEAMALLEPVPRASDFFSTIPRSRRSIVTSSAKASALSRLEVAGIPQPSEMITAEDVDRGKPSPAPYLALLRRCQIPSHRCLVFEDSPTGVASAVAAGCDCIGVGRAIRGHPDLVGWVPDFGPLWDICQITSTTRRAEHVEAT